MWPVSLSSHISTPTATPLPSTSVSSPEFAAVAATAFVVLGALVVFARLRGRS